MVVSSPPTQTSTSATTTSCSNAGCTALGAAHVCVKCGRTIHGALLGCGSVNYLDHENKFLCASCGKSQNDDDDVDDQDDDDDDDADDDDDDAGQLDEEFKRFDSAADAAHTQATNQHQPDNDAATAASAAGFPTAISSAFTEAELYNLNLRAGIAEKREQLAANLHKAHQILKLNEAQGKKLLKQSWEAYRKPGTDVFSKQFQADAVRASTQPMPMPREWSECDAFNNRSDAIWAEVHRQSATIFDYANGPSPNPNAPKKRGESRRKSNKKSNATQQNIANNELDDNAEADVECESDELPEALVDNAADDVPDAVPSYTAIRRGDAVLLVDENGDCVFDDTAAAANMTIEAAFEFFSIHDAIANDSSNAQQRMASEMAVDMFALEAKARNTQRRRVKALDIASLNCPHCGSSDVATRPTENRLQHIANCAAKRNN